MLHGHEEGVEHDANSNGQVDKRVHHHKVHPFFKDHPLLAAVPFQEYVGEFVPDRGARPLGILQL